MSGPARRSPPAASRDRPAAVNTVEPCFVLSKELRVRPSVSITFRQVSPMRTSALLALPCDRPVFRSGPPRAAADETDASIKAGTKLLEEGDRLADEGKPGEAVIRYKSAFEQLLPRLRQDPVQARGQARRDQARAAEGHAPEGVRRGHDSRGIPRQRDGHEGVRPGAAVARPEAAAGPGLLRGDRRLLRPEDQDHAPDRGARGRRPRPSPRSWSGSSARRPGFDKDENKTVIAHELTHALADQHYDLDALHKDAKHDDDRSLAVSALIEGEATLAMMGAQMDDWDGSKIVKMPADDLDRGLSLISPVPVDDGRRQEPASGAADHLRDHDLPLFPRHGLLRQLGQRRRLEGRGRGLPQPARLDRADPPSREVPRQARPADVIDLGELKPGAAGRSWAGTCSASCRPRSCWAEQGPKAAAGWDGDRYAVFEGPDEKLGLVWLSTWDSEDDAREFAQAYARYQTRRMGKDAFQPEQIPDSLWRCQDNVCQVVERRGRGRGRDRGLRPGRHRPLARVGIPSQEDGVSPDSHARIPEAEAAGK